MTVFNRREMTLSSLHSLQAAVATCDGLEATVCLTDDGSTDGTSEAVAAAFPAARITRGSGSLFWNGGMRRSMQEAIDLDPDYFLWLNDDVVLFPDALERLIRTERTERRAGVAGPIVVGSTVDPDMGTTSYGGQVRLHRFRPLRFSTLDPGPAALPCVTMNANCVLLPADVVARMGNLDPAFVHSMGDFDYGLRAHNARIPVLVCAGYVGRCAVGRDRRDILAGGDAPLAFGSLRQAWKSVAGPKAFPIGPWRTFTMRHGGPLWIANWVKPYLNAMWWGFRRGGI